MEMKILSKVLSNRLFKHIHKFIHPDQTGFVPGRHIYSNLCSLFNIMYHDHKEECAIITLDSEKAFDHIEWKFMLSTLWLWQKMYKLDQYHLYSTASLHHHQW